MTLRGWNSYHNPLYHWWKARKYFKFPSIYCYCGHYRWTFGLPINNKYYNRFLDISFHALGWKDKYDSPRHEWNPMINILFLKKWQILFTLYYDAKTANDAGDFAVWEGMLDYLYYDKSIEQCVVNNTWCGKDSSMDIKYALTKKGLEEYGN